MNRKFHQLLSQLMSHTRSATRFGLLLLLCTPSLLLAHSGATVSTDTGLISQGDPALVTTLREHAFPLQRAKGGRDSRNDNDEPPPWPVSTTNILPAGVSTTVTWFSINRARLPAAPDFLHARLRAPPLA
ncbi:MAG: hypothetical protein RIA65_02515 [Woeseia sp.]